MNAQETRYGLTETRKCICVPVTAARVFRAEAFADGLTNDDGNNGDGYNGGKESMGHPRKDRAAADILPSVAVKHRFFPISPRAIINLARLSIKIKFFCNRNRFREILTAGISSARRAPNLEIARCPTYIYTLPES